jgi:hypothetical protein
VRCSDFRKWRNSSLSYKWKSVADDHDFIISLEDHTRGKGQCRDFIIKQIFKNTHHKWFCCLQESNIYFNLQWWTCTVQTKTILFSQCWVVNHLTLKKFLMVSVRGENFERIWRLAHMKLNRKNSKNNIFFSGFTPVENQCSWAVHYSCCCYGYKSIGKIIWFSSSTS